MTNRYATVCHMTNEATYAMTTAEAAEALGVSIKTVTRWAASGKLTPLKKLPGPRGAFIFNSGDVEALLAREPWAPAS